MFITLTISIPVCCFSFFLSLAYSMTSPCTWVCFKQRIDLVNVQETKLQPHMMIPKMQGYTAVNRAKRAQRGHIRWQFDHVCEGVTGPCKCWSKIQAQYGVDFSQDQATKKIVNPRNQLVCHSEACDCNMLADKSENETPPKKNL